MKDKCVQGGKEREKSILYCVFLTAVKSFQTYILRIFKKDNEGAYCTIILFENHKIRSPIMTKIALRTSHTNYPIASPKRIACCLQFSEQQVEKFKEGFLSMGMEDKWVIFYEEDWLYFHRSWTGFGIFKAQIIQEGEGYTINEFWAERDQEKYQNEEDSKDIELLFILIAEFLLEIDARDILSDKSTHPEMNPQITERIWKFV